MHIGNTKQVEVIRRPPPTLAQAIDQLDLNIGRLRDWDRRYGFGRFDSTLAADRHIREAQDALEALRERLHHLTAPPINALVILGQGDYRREICAGPAQTGARVDVMA